MRAEWKIAAGAGARVNKAVSQTGTSAACADGATNEVVACSRDHAHLRVFKHHGFTGHFNPRLYQHRLSWPLEGRIPGPNTGFEVFVPGRQGFRA